MDVKDVKWIDNANYMQLLDKMRNAPIGHRFFVAGTNLQLYFEDAFKRARDATPVHDRVAASKALT